MKRVVVLTGDISLRKIQEQLENVYFGDGKNKEKEAQQLVEEFILKMKSAPLKISLLATGDYNA
jgi:hypothetical protein